MAVYSKTTSVATTTTSCTAPISNEWAATGGSAQWRSLRLVNMGANRIHVALDGAAAVANADETVCVVPSTPGIVIRYRSTFNAIAETGATPLQVQGSTESAWL